MLDLAVDPKKVTANAYICNNCFWFRDYTPTHAWLEQEIDHPWYGIIRQRDLVIKEVQNHNCQTYIRYQQSRKGL